MPFGGSAGTWIGWLVEFGKPLILVSDSPDQREEMVRQLIRIGYDTLEGYLDGGMEAWGATGLPTSSLEVATAQELYSQLEGGGGPVPLDVRFGYEWRAGHIAGSVNVELGELPQKAGALSRDQRYVSVCAGGVRASTAASVLEREGIGNVVLMRGGTAAWEKAGYPLDVENS